MIDRQCAFDWDRAFDDHAKRKEELIEACHQAPRETPSLSVDDACMEIAVSIKRALRQSNFSREQFVDEINSYFSLSDTDKSDRKPLSIHMMNHFLSKPAEYPLQAYLLFPIINILGLEPIQALVETVGGRVPAV